MAITKSEDRTSSPDWDSWAKRAGWTLFLIAAWRVLAAVPMFGIDLDVIREVEKQAAREREVRRLPPSKLPVLVLEPVSFLAVGLAPWATGAVLVLLLGRVLGRRVSFEEDPRQVEVWMRRAAAITTLALGWQVLRYVHRAAPGLAPDPGLLDFYLPNLCAFLAATSLSLFVAQEISRRGVGDGVWILLAAAICLRLTGELRSWQGFQERSPGMNREIALAAGFVFVWIAALVFLLRLHIPLDVRHARHMLGRAGMVSREVPLCPTGVSPIVMASAMVILMQIAARAFGIDRLSAVIGSVGFTFVVLYAGLIAAFSIAMAAMRHDPDADAERLKSVGSFLSGIRPGRKTAEALDRIYVRATVCGLVCLIVFAIVPDLLLEQFLRSSSLLRLIRGHDLAVLAAAVSTIWGSRVAHAGPGPEAAGVPAVLQRPPGEDSTAAEPEREP